MCSVAPLPQPHTSYIIRVRAKNRAGLSETAGEVFVKTRSVENLVEEVEAMPRVTVITIVVGAVLGISCVVLLSACCFW